MAASAADMAASAPEGDVPTLSLTSKQVDHCRFEQWYPQFFRHTIPSRIIPLPADVVTYLLDDGTVVLPDRDHPADSSRNQAGADDSDTDEWAERAEDGPTAPTPSFPEFEERIRKAIDKLGGSAFPKLNWSAPRDATWISVGNTLECKSLGDILLLLKSSDFVTHDMTMAYEGCEDVERMAPAPDTLSLVLRRFVPLHTESEFRCFVRGKRLVAICQRDHTTFYPTLPSLKSTIQQEIETFFATTIQGKFPDPDFVFDVYREGKDKLKLIDFNPFSPVTDALLFTWHDLLTCPWQRTSGQARVAAEASRSGPDDESHLEQILRLNNEDEGADEDDGGDVGDDDDQDDDITFAEEPAAEAPRRGMGLVDRERDEALALLAEQGPREISQTDHLNKSLLESFRQRLVAPGHGLPVPSDGELAAAEAAGAAEWDIGTEEEMAAQEQAAAAMLAALSGGLAGEDSEDESEGEEGTEIDFRIVESPSNVQPSIYLASRLPKDVINVATGEDIDTLARLYMQGKLEPDTSSDEDDDEGQDDRETAAAAEAAE